MSDYNVGDLVAEFLQRVGVDTAFGVISVHNIPMVDAIGRRNAIRYVMSRGEMGAGHMADAYARARDGLGVVITSTGPGAANVPGALVEARFAGSPVLHLTGQTATANMDRDQGSVHDVPDQLGMLRSISKAAYRVRSADTALGTLVQAATEALTAPMGPVSVEIPIDIQRTPIDRPEMLDWLELPVAPGWAGNETSLDAIAKMAESARRPILWLGTGAKRAGKAAERLAGLGFAIVTSVNGRASVPEDHPMSLGAFQAVPLVEQFYGSCDLMIVAGGRLRGHETKDMSLKLPARRVQIDIDPRAQGRTYSSDIFHAGDAAAALDALADRLEGRLKVEDGWRDEVKALKERVIDAYKGTLGPYRDMAETLRRVLPEDAIWVRDITLNNTTWGNRLFPLKDARNNVYPVGAAIGPGLALGIGASFAAKGRKTVTMVGDGGFALNMSELWTAVQEQTPLVIMVMNDKGYGVIRHIQDSMYEGRRFFGDLMNPPFKGLAELAGIPYHLARSVAETGEAVAKALEVNGPVLVEVDMTAIGEFPPYFAPPPWAAKKD